MIVFSISLILGFDKDLVQSDSEDLSRLQGIDLQDKISELIDSEEFSRACSFEDEWIISECDKALATFEQMDQSIETSTVLMTKLNGLFSEVRLSREQRAKAVAEWDSYRKAFEAKSKMIFRKPSGDYVGENDIEEVL